MQTFPMFLKMKGNRVLILGGGEQAAQKVRLVMKTEADILVVSETLNAELVGYSAEGRIKHQTGDVTPELLNTAVLVFSATGCLGAGACHAALADPVNALINVVDQPDYCGAITPAIVDRDPVVVAIGTEGKGPVLGRLTKREIETMLEPRLGRLANFAGNLRPRVAQFIAPRLRREFWRWAFDGKPRRLFAAGNENEAFEAIEAQIDAKGANLTQGGMIAHIELQSDAVDMLTLRAVRQMQEADVLFYDAEIPLSLLEPARRDAERVSFDPENYIDAFEQAEKRKAENDRVVILTRELGSDPFG